MDDTLGDAPELLAAAGRRLAGEGLVIGTAGNLSSRVGDLIAITATGSVLKALTTDQVSVVDLDGTQVRGELAPSSELELHLGIYRRYRAGAVVHTHSPLATALACVLEELPVIHYQMLELGGAIRVVPYLTFGSTELAEATLDALRDRNAALMSNHGAIAYGPDLESAVQRALLLEWACGLYWRAATIGMPRTLDEAQQQEFLRAFADSGYGRVQRRSR